MIPKCYKDDIWKWGWRIIGKGSADYATWGPWDWLSSIDIITLLPEGTRVMSSLSFKFLPCHWLLYLCPDVPLPAPGLIRLIGKQQPVVHWKLNVPTENQDNLFLDWKFATNYLQPQCCVFHVFSALNMDNFSLTVSLDFFITKFKCFYLLYYLLVKIKILITSV